MEIPLSKEYLGIKSRYSTEVKERIYALDGYDKKIAAKEKEIADYKQKISATHDIRVPYEVHQQSNRLIMERDHAYKELETLKGERSDVLISKEDMDDVLKQMR